MTTAIYPSYSDPHSFRQQNIPRQHQQHTQPTYSAAIPLLYPNENGIINGIQPKIYKQINVIPGLAAKNAVVDTGVQLIHPTGTQVQVSSNTAAANDFDGKRMRRSIQRRTVDYNASTIEMLKHRLYKRSILQKPVIQPDPLYYLEIVQPRCILHNPINSVTSRFVRASTNKVRCPVFTVAWTPEGRRVVTGTSSGEFTLWNGLTFNFETILQAHESAVRAMEWSHNDMWLLSGDHSGVIKYWQSNMNNVKMIQAHTDPVRGLSFCPTDNKFVTCSDDGLLKVWDFYRCQEERALRGHGADVKCVGWHPSKCMVASGSKDSQQPLKLWDPKIGKSLATIHGHKSTVMDLDWNKNGNWLLTGSRDRLVKVFDIRVMKEITTFRGHKKEAASVNWHPLYEEMLASGGSDGSIMFWLLSCEKELGVMENAHDGMIWDLKWHPLGHILCSGSNDHTTKFWTRNRPGDKMRDKYNLNILPSGFDDDYEYELPNTSQSESGSMLHDSLMNTSMASNGTPAKTTLDESELESPIVKALIEQSSLDVVAMQSTETPAQIYTVSQLRATAPTFKIDANKQKLAIEDVDKLEKRRERQLCRGDDKGSKRRRVSNHDDATTSNAPSLLDLDIAPPAFLKDHDWEDDSQDPPFIDDARNRSSTSDRIPDGNHSGNNTNNMNSMNARPVDHRRFDGPPPQPPPHNTFNSNYDNMSHIPQPPSQDDRFTKYSNNEPMRNYNYNHVRDNRRNENFSNENFHNAPNHPMNEQRFKGGNFPPHMNGVNHGPPQPPGHFDDRPQFNNEFIPEKRWEDERFTDRWQQERQHMDGGRR